MNANRRHFLGTAAGAATVACLGGTVGAQTEKADLPIIDTHQHLWDLDKFTLPWVADEASPEVLKRSYVTKDFLEATKGLNVVKAIYMEVDVRPDLQVKEAEHVIELSRSAAHPTVAAVISGRPGSEGFAEYIARFENTPEIKGVRQVLQVPETPAGFCLGSQFVKSVQLLGDMGKSFDLCMRPAELADGAKLAAECPDTVCIVDHCGNADPKAWMPENRRDGKEPWHEVDQWKRDMEALSKQKNVICKISGIIARAPKGWTTEDLAAPIHFCLDTFGPDRVLYGGDWPVCKIAAPYKDWVASLKSIVASRPVAEQKKLLHDNAVRVYGLS
ncbi:MAG: amidohydrolase family protein [Verrucomicrobiota bacterium]